MPEDAPILWLPNEILDSIVAFSRLADSRCVPELRLTSRRFSNVAAQHLIPSAMVDFSRPSTLSRLNAITRNRAIAAGVREICVCVHFYNEVVAADIESFVAFVTAEWNERCRRVPSYSTKSDQEWDFGLVIHEFLEETMSWVPQDETLLEGSRGVAGVARRFTHERANRVLRAAFTRYSAGFAIQAAAAAAAAATEHLGFVACLGRL